MKSSNPQGVQLLNKTARFLKLHSWPRFRFDEDQLAEAAIRNTRFDDFGDTYYLQGLKQLLQSIHEDVDLHPMGHLTLHQAILTSLENRLIYMAAKQQTPDRFKSSLKPPLIVIGLPRSGTTFLHRLLSADPAHRAVPFWETTYPLPRNMRDTPVRRFQRAKRELGVRRWIAPELDRKHLIRADLPEECMFGLGMTFTSLLFWVLAPLYSYLGWYNSFARDKKYLEYRDLLHIWQATDPAKPLVLKAPAHTGALAELIRYVPEALIVQTHRDPVEVVGSFQSLNHTTHTMVTDKIDIALEAKANLDFLWSETERNLNGRKQYPTIVYDIQYSQLVQDPMGTIADIYKHFDLPLSKAYQSQLRAYITENPQHKHGKHSYHVENYGLSEKLIKDRFTDYSSQFGFDRE